MGARADMTQPQSPERVEVNVSPAANASPLFLELDCLSWGIDTQRLSAECGELVERLDPMWIRVANWSQPTVDFLKRFPGRRVLWKIEYTGYSTAFDPGPDGRCLADIVTDQMFDLDLDLVVYTYNRWNVERLHRRVAAFGSLRLETVPIAQRPELAEPTRAAARASSGYSPDDVVLGVGGAVNVPEKRIEEVVDGFLNTCDKPNYRLLTQVIVNPADPGPYLNWRADDAARDSRLTVGTGWYNTWTEATAFYRALDYFLVPYTGDSWCRMLAEAVGYGIPTVAVRADSATNVIIPGLTLVDQLADFHDPALARALVRAAKVAPGIRRFVLDEYSMPRVRAVYVDLLRRHTAPNERPRLEELLSNEDAIRGMDASFIH
jgi:glycosyltransferase involved in cell wall biosynthesis